MADIQKLEVGVKIQTENLVKRQRNMEIKMFYVVVNVFSSLST